MFDFLGNRLQKAMNKMAKKTVLKEEDLVEISREIRIALLEADVNLQVVKEFIKNVKEKTIGKELIGKLNPEQQMIKIVHEELKAILGEKQKSIKLQKNSLNTILFVGLQGTGKTTSVAKLANYFKKNNLVNKILLVAADIYRPAAVEQLKVLGRNLNIEVFFQENSKPQEIVQNAMILAKKEEYDCVIIDTAGRLSINEELMQELQDIKRISNPDEIIFVSDAFAGQEIINVSQTFDDKLSLTGLIVTKLDSDARGGSTLSLTSLLKKPILFIGTGEKIGNLDVFYPDRMADRILGMGDVLSLIEQAEQVIDEDKTKKITNRLFSGNFDLDDLLESLKQMQKLGKMSKLLKMIPGMANKIDESKIALAETRMKTFKIIISSMTKEERKNPKLLKMASRKQRIIKGSGRNAQEFNTLVTEWEKMSNQVKNMSKGIKNGQNPFGGMF